MLPSALLGLTAVDGLRATAGDDSTAVTAPTPKKKTQKELSTLMSLA